jgi:hypothetical protein
VNRADRAVNSSIAAVRAALRAPPPLASAPATTLAAAHIVEALAASMVGDPACDLVKVVGVARDRSAARTLKYAAELGATH